MNRRFSRLLSSSLAVGLLCGPLVSAALATESILVPRMGYAPSLPVVVYLQLDTPQERKAAEKALGDANSLHLRPKNLTKILTFGLLGDDDDDKAKTTNKRPEKPSAKTQDAPSVNDAAVSSGAPVYGPYLNEEKDLMKDRKRRAEEAKRAERLRVKLQEKFDAIQNAPVEGTYYLYSFKNQELLLGDGEEPHKIKTTDPVAPYDVKFKASKQSGLYDVAVRGSGHRSKSPLLVSDTLYWDALQPVIQGLPNTHCPHIEGTYEAVQYCFHQNVHPADNTVDITTPTSIVDGGWYTGDIATNATVKDSDEIARITITLLNLYKINPESLSYVQLTGTGYGESPLPDLLDEAHWGLQYFVSIQRPDGSIPGGIKALQPGPDTEPTYQLLPATANATALGVTALAHGAAGFKKANLSLAVTMMRSAQKGWEYLKAHPKDVDPQLYYLAAQALSQVSDDSEFSKTAGDLKAKVSTIDAENAILLGSQANGVVLTDKDMNTASADPEDILPLIVSLEQNDKRAIVPLNDWLQKLFGYEEITLVRDENLQMAKVWSDPLQWAAIRTADYTGKLGRHLTNAVVPQSAQELAKQNQEIAIKTAEAKKRLQPGIDALKLNPLQRVTLAYLLALMNEATAPGTGNPNIKPKNENDFNTPQYPVKGYYPKMI